MRITPKQDWVKISPDVLRNQRLGATITRHPDRFVVQVGDYQRDCRGLAEARRVAGLMVYETKQFDLWETPTGVLRETMVRRGRQTLRQLKNRTIMAAIMAGIAALVGFVLR